MHFGDLSLWMPPREISYLKEEQLANTHHVRPAARVSAL